MAKINFSKWKENVHFEQLANGYRIEGLTWWKRESSHGRSKGVVKCPCCDCHTDIYIWSFSGGGKRCSNCNILLGSQGAWISKNEVTENEKIKYLDFSII